MIEAQTKKVDQRLDALLLVGGFSGSEYLFRKVQVRIHLRRIVTAPYVLHLAQFHGGALALHPSQDQFGSQIRVIVRPADCDTATVRGAAQYGLARRPLVSSVIAPQSYMLKVRRDLQVSFATGACAYRLCLSFYTHR